MQQFNINSVPQNHNYDEQSYKDDLFKQESLPQSIDLRTMKFQCDEEIETYLNDIETIPSSDSSLNNSQFNHSAQKSDKLKDIKNFQLFNDLVNSSESFEEDIKDNNEINQTGPSRTQIRLPKLVKIPSKLESSYFSEGSKTQKKKISLSEYEILYEKTKFVEIIENKPGNYNRYVTKVFETMRGFNKIDFSPKIDERKQVLGPNIHKFTLIIDLDETLIHSDFNKQFEGEYDHIINFTHEGELISIPLILRPGLMDFLDFCNQHFEICIFTASRKEYADCILNFLDPYNQIFKYRFYREDCISIKGKIFLKDLRIFTNRYQENIIIIDNSLYSFANQLSNGILITSFYNNEKDKELINLKKYLKNIVDLDKDIRIVNEKVYNFEQIKNDILLQ